MGRDKQEALATKDAKAAAAKAAAQPPPPEEPKRKLHKIRTNVLVAKPPREVALGKPPPAASAAPAREGAPSGEAAAEWTVLLKEWQRMPKQLLQQLCDRTLIHAKQKAPKPEYQLHKRGELFHARVRLLLEKDKPTTYSCPVGAATSADAYQRCALYALYQLNPAVQHHRILPDLYADLWRAWQASPPPPPPHPRGSGDQGRHHGDHARGGGEHSGGHSEHETGARGSSSRSSSRPGKPTDKALEFTLSDAGREAAQRALSEVRRLGSNEAAPCDDEDGAREEDHSSARSVDRLTDQLQKLGFARAASAAGARHAARIGGSAKSQRDLAIDHLCLSLPEDELPPAFQAKKTLQIIRLAPRAEAAAPEAEAATPDVAAALEAGEAPLVRACGFTREECERAMREAEGCELQALILLLGDLGGGGVTWRLPSASEDECVDSEITPLPELEHEEAFEEELMVLREIYGDRFTSTLQRTSRGAPVHQLEVEMADSTACAGTLHLLALPSSAAGDRGYPHTAALPYFIPKHPNTLPPDSRVALALELQKLAAQLAAEGAPQVYEAATFVEEHLSRFLSSPPARPPPLLAAAASGSCAELPPPPPDDAPPLPAEESSGGGGGGGGGGDGGGRRAGRERREGRAAAKGEAAGAALQAEQRRLDTLPQLEPMRAARQRLPAARARDEFLSLLHAHRVVVVAGETGCGKSTQIPQFVLEHECSSGRGGECSVVVTQPRRIAAISLAERVAAEREGRAAGGSVGYAVRLEQKQSASTRILFCTTGVLLSRLRDDAELRHVSHVVVDEVHERSVDSDFLLIVLRDALAANPHLKVVLMSATLNASLFADYFNNAAILTIPGRTFPVTDFSLEDVVQRTGFVARGKIALRIAEQAEELHGLEFVADEEAEGAPPGVYSVRVREALLRLPAAAIPTALVGLLIQTLDREAEEAARGAVLIFLPGVAEIKRMARELAGCEGAERWLLLPLYGELPAAEQRKVFERPPSGLRKVVLSTNVAETSLTIDDITVVIDTGRVKQAQYDALNACGQLVETWVDLSSRKQRRGRAGRVQQGEYYALYSLAQQRRLEAHAPPEILRVPLEKLFLQVKGIGLAGGDVAAFLGRALQPPDAEAISLAADALVRIGALTADAACLTPLGHHLARMPLEPRVGKTLVYGAVLGCIDQALTIAAAMSLSPSPFLSPFDKRAEAQAARAPFCREMSDQMSLLRAYEAWAAERELHGERAARKFAAAHFLSASGMEELSALRHNLSRTLAELGLLPSAEAAAAERQAVGSQANLVRALLCAGLYPNIVHIRVPKTKYEQGVHGAVEAESSDARAIKFYLEPGGRVFLSPSSALFSVGKFEHHRWLVYQSKQQVDGGKLFVRDVTAVSQLALLLFGGEVKVNHDNGSVTVDGVVKFDAPGRVAVLIRDLRTELAKLLSQKIADPALDIGNHPVARTIVDLLATERAAK